MVYYPFDHNNTLFANKMFNYLESVVGPYFSMLLGAYTRVPLATGRLAQVIERGGKIRIFAICNYINQRLLFPVRKWAMKVLSSIHPDWTFDQERPLLRFKSKRKYQTFYFDLKSATCHLPLYQLDVKNAFLHGDPYEEVYIEIAHKYGRKGELQKVCRLKKSLYGFKQSPRAWFDKFSKAID